MYYCVVIKQILERAYISPCYGHLRQCSLASLFYYQNFQYRHANLSVCIQIKDICQQIPPASPATFRKILNLGQVRSPPTGVRMLGCGVHPPQGLGVKIHKCRGGGGVSDHKYLHCGIYQHFLFESLKYLYKCVLTSCIACSINSQGEKFHLCPLKSL